MASKNATPSSSTKSTAANSGPGAMMSWSRLFRYQSGSSMSDRPSSQRRSNAWNAIWPATRLIFSCSGRTGLAVRWRLDVVGHQVQARPQQVERRAALAVDADDLAVDDRLARLHAVGDARAVRAGTARGRGRCSRAAAARPRECAPSRARRPTSPRRRSPASRTTRAPPWPASGGWRRACGRVPPRARGAARRRSRRRRRSASISCVVVAMRSSVRLHRAGLPARRRPRAVRLAAATASILTRRADSTSGGPPCTMHAIGGECEERGMKIGVKLSPANEPGLKRAAEEAERLGLRFRLAERARRDAARPPTPVRAERRPVDRSRVRRRRYGARRASARA